MRSVIWSARIPRFDSDSAQNRKKSATRALAGSVHTDISECCTLDVYAAGTGLRSGVQKQI